MIELLREVVQFAQRLIARCRKSGVLRRFPALHFDGGDGVGDLISCRYGVYNNLSFWNGDSVRVYA